MHSRRSQRHALHVWALALLAFTLVSGFSGSAFAAVPMCGPRAQTIAAPPIGTPASDDVLAPESPCQDEGTLFVAGGVERHAPRATPPSAVPERVPPPARLFVSRPAPVTRALARATLIDLPLGFQTSVYRPPRRARG